MTTIPSPQRSGDQHRRWLDAITNNSAMALFIMDEHQHCTFMNPAAEELTGFRTAEVQGRPLHDFVHHTHPDGTPYHLEDCPIDRAFPTNMREQGEEVFVRRDGTFYPVAFTASPIREDGRTVGTIIEARDLTRERQMERDRDQFIRERAEYLAEESQIIDTLRRIGTSLTSNLEVDAIVQQVTDEATQLTGAQFGAFFYNMVSEKGETYTLYTISGVPREMFSKFPMPRNTQVFEPTFHGTSVVRSDDITADPRYGQNAPYHGMPKGHLPVVSYLAVPVISRNGEVLGGLFFGHEKPAVFQERHERLVIGIAAWAAVATDNARLYAAERRARREAEEANRAKSEFLATMSHELRTPLNAIGGYTELLATGIRGELLPQQIDDLRRIKRSQQHLLGLINDVLNFAKLEAGRVEFRLEPTPLLPVIRELDDLIRPQVLAKGLTYETIADAADVAVLADHDKLRQIVVNLLTNAVKYTQAGGSVRVACAVLDDTVEVRVEDNGIGIPEDKLERVFDPFVQVASGLARDSEGVGLGLAISQELAQSMDGEVRVESTPGKGSIFTLSLPRA